MQQYSPLCTGQVPGRIMISCSSVNLQLTKIRSKLNKRNIITAKLSVLVMMLLFLAGVLLSITYTSSSGYTGNTFCLFVTINFIFQDLSIQTRMFFNSFFIDLMLVVVSPCLLLYSSQELRTTIRIIIKNETLKHMLLQI